MRHIIFVSFLLIVLLTSCSPSVAIPHTANDPALPAVQTQRVATLTLAPSPSTTPTPRVITTPSLLSTPHTLDVEVSPNGEYFAYAYFYDPAKQQTLEIKDKEDKLIWSIPFQAELSPYEPNPTMGIIRWSNDSTQLYFYYYVWLIEGRVTWLGYELQQIDMKTGNVEHVLPGEGEMSFAISPDSTQVAYIRNQDQPRIIYIRNLSTGLEKEAEVIFASKNYVAIGNIQWSPNSAGLFFETQDHNEMLQTIYLNLSTMEQKVIKEYPASDSLGGTSFIEGWLDDDTLVFTEFGSNGSRQTIHVNVRNNQTIVIGTPTPIR